MERFGSTRRGATAGAFMTTPVNQTRGPDSLSMHRQFGAGVAGALPLGSDGFFSEPDWSALIGP
jgi:hypothetical protein